MITMSKTASSYQHSQVLCSQTTGPVECPPCLAHSPAVLRKMSSPHARNLPVCFCSTVLYFRLFVCLSSLFLTFLPYELHVCWPVWSKLTTGQLLQKNTVPRIILKVGGQMKEEFYCPQTKSFSTNLPILGHERKGTEERCCRCPSCGISFSQSTLLSGQK